MGAFEVNHISPDGVYASPAYSQAVAVRGNSKTIYIGGQNGIDANGELVGRDDFARQTRQALQNIKTILASLNADFNDLIKLSIYMKEGCDPRVGFGVFREVVGMLKEPPLITVLFVCGFARPDCLVEIDGIAAVEDNEPMGV